MGEIWEIQSLNSDEGIMADGVEIKIDEVKLIENCKELLNELNIKIERLSIEVAILKARSLHLLAFINVTDSNYSHLITDSGSKKRMRRGSGGKSRVAADFCFNMIKNSGRRIFMRELFPAAISDGVNIGGTDEKSVLAGYLSRDDRLNFVHGEGWGINGEIYD